MKVPLELLCDVAVFKFHWYIERMGWKKKTLSADGGCYYANGIKAAKW